MNEHESIEEYNDKVDVEIRTWLEHNEMPQWFVNELADKYLNLTYIRERIKLLYPQIIEEITPYLDVHYDDEEQEGQEDNES